MLLYNYLDFTFNNHSKISGTGNNCECIPGQDTFECDQVHVIKNQPITVLVLLSESLGI